jgi:tripartite-type tricarboxylate transporter receptor subunit TctC
MQAEQRRKGDMAKRGKQLGVIGGLLVIFMILFYAGEARSEFPERNITVVVAFDPGAATDIVTRALALGAEKQLGKPLVIENKGGGGGAVALAVVAGATPDGYTLCAAPNVSVVDTPLMQKAPFKPLKSFSPILGHSLAEHTALVVKSDAPWKTFKEFIEFAKSNPGKIKYSSAGVGTGMHVAMEVIARKEGIKWVHVPYKGSAPSITAVLGGHVDACSAGIGWQVHAKSGAVRALADHGKKRGAEFPDVPTLWELGYGFSNETIHAILGPAGLPPEVKKKLEEGFRKGMETPEFKSAQENLYLSPVHYDSKAYEKHLKERWVSVEKIMIEAGIIKEAATQPE